jgi:hypothetical protein
LSFAVQKQKAAWVGGDVETIAFDDLRLSGSSAKGMVHIM